MSRKKNKNDGVSIFKIEYHKPALVETVAGFLVTCPNVLIVDATVGDGGHSEALLKASAPLGRVIGIDLDSEAVARSRSRLEIYGERFVAVHSNFANLSEILKSQKIDHVDAIFADLGLSTLQIADESKGFSYLRSGPLSMQMNSASEKSAVAIVNSFSEKQLWSILSEYGEERHARRIAHEITQQRKIFPIETTDQLSDIVRRCVPKNYVIKSLARVFQSIRISVNSELDNLKRFLPQAINLLKIGGRLAIISYHSLEDRIVKAYLTELEKPCTCPPSFPMCVCGKRAMLNIIARLVRPTEAEISSNPAIRSARLRVAEKISDN